MGGGRLGISGESIGSVGKSVSEDTSSLTTPLPVGLAAAAAASIAWWAMTGVRLSWS